MPLTLLSELFISCKVQTPPYFMRIYGRIARPCSLNKLLYVARTSLFHANLRTIAHFRTLPYWRVTELIQLAQKYLCMQRYMNYYQSVQFQMNEPQADIPPQKTCDCSTSSSNRNMHISPGLDDSPVTLHPHASACPSRHSCLSHTQAMTDHFLSCHKQA